MTNLNGLPSYYSCILHNEIQNQQLTNQKSSSKKDKHQGKSDTNRSSIPNSVRSNRSEEVSLTIQEEE
jgi:hypothetical protein